MELNSPRTLQKLPPEILLKICSYLSHRSKRNPLINVCWINGTGCVLITSERILNNDNLFGNYIEIQEK